MLFTYLISNYMTLLIISAVVVLIFVNKDYDIPASQMFLLSVGLLLVITVFDTVEELCLTENDILVLTLAERVKLRTIAAAIKYILRPFVIMIEVFIIIPPKNKWKPLAAIPAAANLIVYSTMFMESGIAVSISPNNTFVPGPLRMTVYYTQIFYILLLVWISAKYFKDMSRGKNVIVILVTVQTIMTSLLEYGNRAPGFVNPVTALAMLEYYIYLSVVYQQEMRNTISQKDLDLEKERMLILRNQIQPHFIYNSLSIIRSLAKRDSERAVSCIDTFSDYLKAHIGAIENDELVDFEKELGNVRVYLDLVRADKSRKLEVIYELGTVDFRIPPLSLEPIVENAVNHGIGREGGTITIHTEEAAESFVITISDNGTAKNSPTDDVPFHMGVGIENTRKRLSLLCGGTLEMDMQPCGTTVTLNIPKDGKDVKNEDPYSRRQPADS